MPSNSKNSSYITSLHSRIEAHIFHNNAYHNAYVRGHCLGPTAGIQIKDNPDPS